MNVLKCALIFTSGVLAGGGISALIFKKKYEKIYREKAEKELAEMDDYYQNLLNAGYTEDIEKEEEEENFQEVVTKKPNVSHEKRKGSFATDYTKCFGERVDPAEREHPEEDAPVRERREPKIIRKDQFGSDGYAQRVLYYYTEDDDLTPEGENFGEIIECDEVKDTIGNALIKYGFADEGNTDREMYVRNFDRKTDYCIIKVVGSLSDMDNGG